MAKKEDLEPRKGKRGRGRPRKEGTPAERKQARKEQKRAWDHAHRSRDQYGAWWWFVLYEDSAPADWRNLLNGMHIAYVVSPYHDHDENPDGTPKKPHYHILMKFDTNWMFKDVKKITDMLRQPEPERALNPVGTARYLTHMDNPEKYQYSAEKIEEHNGLTMRSIVKMSDAEEDMLSKEIEMIIRERHITNFARLQFTLSSYDDELYAFARRHAYYFVNITKSLFFEAEQAKKEAQNNEMKGKV